MKNNKTDARSRFTQAIVKKSLLKLIAEKPLQNITVAELCREASITRGTFYNHYYDVFDVYESVENEFINEVIEQFDNMKTYSFDYGFFYGIMTVLSKNSDITAMIISNPSDSRLLKRLISFVHDKYVLDFSERFPDLDKNVIENVFTFASNGSVSVLVEWFKSDQKLPLDELAHIIGEFNNIIIAGCNNFQKTLSAKTSPHS